MSKGNQDFGFVLEIGAELTVPQDAFIQVPHSKARSGETLGLIGFLQEVALAPQERGRQKVQRRYKFATRDTKGKGLKCFMPSDVLGKAARIVMLFDKGNYQGQIRRSVAVHFPEQFETYAAQYQADQEQSVVEPDSGGESMVSAE